jgi:predicted nucleic acid-binding protein
VTHYLDTSVVVALLLTDVHSSRAEAWLIHTKPILMVSDFCAVEFAAVISRRVRMSGLSPEHASLALDKLDHWLSHPVHLLRGTPEQMALAGQIVRDFTTKLSAPDAIHLAIARDLGATLVTFDGRLAEAARRHVVPVTIPA